MRQRKRGNQLVGFRTETLPRLISNGLQGEDPSKSRHVEKDASIDFRALLDASAEIRKQAAPIIPYRERTIFALGCTQR